MIVNNELLKQAIRKALVENEKDKIGLLKEHTLHRVLKFYISNDEKNHEIKIGRMYADVKIDNHIYEVQTKAFNNMREKLDTFLEDYQVTIVYPLAKNKLIYTYNNLGELVKEKKSPKHSCPLEICIEMYKIKKYLNNKNLTFKVMMLDMLEERVEVPVTYKRRKGVERINQIPKEVYEIIDLESINDYLNLLKRYNLPSNFNSKTFGKLTKINSSKVSTVLNVLTYLNVVLRIKKEGNSYIYKLNEA